ncbi:MAG: aminotransferase class I/II-fold pyridoxal phosphate-dependent enzyme, partial [Candidatus Cloacimonetes bacterium]|nr:aminotransferase class I/II-fold pyridoxal phosphate-dependent enzyme [Candidatus Cloacimonadota bacterium]
ELMHAITNAHQYISTCASLISQKAAIRALSPDGMKSVTILRKILKKQKKKLVTFLKELFPALQYIDPQAAPYLFLSWNRDDHLISDLLAKNGIIVIPGSAFGKNGSNWIRMNYAINDDKMKLLFKKLSAMSLILK